MSVTQVILVDEMDNQVGVHEKLAAHKKGLLHRAFSVFIFNSRGEMLLQQRSKEKYHSGGLWTNACCSHPVPGEATAAAAIRRTKEELGITIAVTKIFDFVYRADLENGLIENEFDHVFAGEYDGDINFSREEIMNCCYKSVEEIQEALDAHLLHFTAWFEIAFPTIKKWWEKRYLKDMS